MNNKSIRHMFCIATLKENVPSTARLTFECLENVMQPEKHL